MGQILHGSARTTAAVRRAIQRQASLRTLSKRHGINLCRSGYLEHIDVEFACRCSRLECNCE